MDRALFTTFESALGKQAVLTSAADCLAYSFDNSSYRQTPTMVLLPTRSEHVQAAVHLARQFKLPLTARGRGTNTTGASIPAANGIVISFERMNRIVRIAADERIAVVQPGVLNGDLQNALTEFQLFWPPDPSSAPFCSIGGNIACNAGGPRAVKYGATRDNVLALKAITGYGELVEFGSATSKNATGFDLSRVLIGSEGGLALVVEATLKLTPKPMARQLLRVLYRDVESAAHAVTRLMKQTNTPSMLEFMDATAIALARDIGGANLPDAGALLIIEADGEPNQLPQTLQMYADIAQGAGCIGISIAQDVAEQHQLLAARKALSPALRSLANGKINEDVVVPITKVPDLVRFVEHISVEQRLIVVCFGHIGNGNVHVNIMYDKTDATQTANAEHCAERLFAKVLALGGMLSGEHGIGLSKRAFMSQAFSAETLYAMRSIKKLFDPDGILNPGKTLPD
jgi:D-lactate dehydrogenase